VVVSEKVDSPKESTAALLARVVDEWTAASADNLRRCYQLLNNEVPRPVYLSADILSVILADIVRQQAGEIELLKKQVDGLQRATQELNSRTVGSIRCGPAAVSLRQHQNKAKHAEALAKLRKTFGTLVPAKFVPGPHKPPAEPNSVEPHPTGGFGE
jgi:hypothetical protein